MTTNSLDFLLNLQANTSGFDQGINGAKFAVNALMGAMAALGMGLGVKELAEAADSYAVLSAKIQQSTKDSGNFEQAIAGVHQIALQTNSSLDATGDLFTRLNTVAKDMGKSQQFALDMTSTVTKAIQLGGGSAQASEAAVQQFIQAMQGGVLRGEEFNSIMENGYGLAEALAKGLGVTTGELRKMAENGELSAERVLAALAKQKAGVDAQYSEMPLTISKALQKIATQWQILIGEMDQANGASATVAQWLSVLADNLDIVEVLLKDIGSGFVWFGDQLKKIDPQTIEALKTALLSAYDAVKSLGELLAGAFERGVDVINTMLGQIFNFSSGIDSATDKTNGFTKALQAANVLFGFISDGFKALNIGINLIIGAAYDAAGAFSHWKSKLTFGDTSAQAVKDFEVMSAKAQEYYKKSSDGAMEFKSAGVEAIRQIGLTQDEKNAERIANNAKTLTDLKAQEAKHVSDYKAISDERIKLNQQLVDARKSGDKSAIEAAVAGLAELDKKEKEYQAESNKIKQAKIAAAQAVAEATIKSADAAGQAELKALNAKIAAQGLKAEFDSTGKVVVSAMNQGVEATTKQADALTDARKGATALGLDLDVALNRVSEKFAANKVHLDNYANGLVVMGATGKQAAELTYEAWQKWAEQAKSPAEINAAKAKLKEFEQQGVFSAKQVEMGMRYLDEVNGKLPQNISEVEKAYKLLGITSREEANKMADSQMKAFNIMSNSGTASAENIKQALINMADKIYASGDAAKIAWYEAKLSANGLQSSVDSLGKASVKSMDDLSDSVDRVGRTASGPAADGFRELGRVARDEARSAADEWEAAMAKVANDKKAFAAETKARGEALSKAVYEYDSYTRAQLEDKIRSMGYSEDKVKELANSIWSQGMSADSRAASNNAVQGVNGVVDAMSKAEFDKARKEGKTTQWGTNKINELLNNIGTSTASTSTGVSSPNIASNSISPPQIQSPQMPKDLGSSSPTVNYQFNLAGKQFNLNGPASEQSNINALLSELEQLSRAR